MLQTNTQSTVEYSSSSSSCNLMGGGLRHLCAASGTKNATTYTLNMCSAYARDAPPFCAVRVFFANE